MPKIIENLQERLLSAARLQLEAEGYSALTMRGIAKASGVGVGTVYNYYPSKDALIASFVAADWRAVMEQIAKASEGCSAERILHAEYDGVRRFSEQHRALFSDPGAIRTYAALPRDWHERLRAQLAAPLAAALRREGHPNAAFLSLFLVESLLTWSAGDADRDALFAVFEPILKNSVSEHNHSESNKGV